MVRFRTLAAVTAAAATLLAGCSDPTGRDTASVATTSVLIGGADAGFHLPDGRSTTAAGMRGVAAAVPVTQEFRAAVSAADPKAVELDGAAQGYDAVVTLALAAEVAKSDAPGKIAREIVEVTRGGDLCSNFQRCRNLIDKRANIDYEGLTGGISMLSTGDPGEATFSTVEITRDGSTRNSQLSTEQAPPLATPRAPADPAFGPPADGVLKIGSLLPIFGPEGNRARAALAGAKVAVQELNDNGGVLGTPVQLLPDESGDGGDAAIGSAVDKLKSAGVDAVLGGTNYAIDRVAVGPVTDAGIILMSPTDSHRAMTLTPSHGLYFRLVAPDDLLGRATGNLVVHDGDTKIAFAVGADTDDQALSVDVTAALTASDAGVVVRTALDGTSAAAAARQIADSGAQAVLLIGPPAESAALLRELIAVGKGPASFPVYGVPQNMVPDLVTKLS